MRRKKKRWHLTKKTYKVSTMVPATSYEAILKIIESGAYINIQGYLRELIREDLQDRKKGGG